MILGIIVICYVLISYFIVFNKGKLAGVKSMAKEVVDRNRLNHLGFMELSELNNEEKENRLINMWLDK